MRSTTPPHTLTQFDGTQSAGSRSARSAALALAGGLLFASTATGFAETLSWKEGVAGCTGSSPFIEALISKTDPDVRPLMRIGSMQAWAIKDETGKLATALTTDDGLTIVGKIVGPQGEDISGALLATVPDPGMAASVVPPQTFPQTPNSDVPSAGPPFSETPTQSTPPRSSPDLTASPALNRLQPVLRPTESVAPSAVATQPDTPATDVETAPITALEQPTANVQAGIDAIFNQAGDERIWFSAGPAKADAPVVYMLADPECPHCQWTIDRMHGPIASGDIDLRIIFAPITGVQGFDTSLSILHAENIPETFMAHMTSTTRGTAAVNKMDTTQADRAVVQGIVDNINWMRANRMPGVPFFLYQTDAGAQFAFSELPPDILTVAKAEAARVPSDQ